MTAEPRSAGSAADTREAIVQAALELMSEHSYDGTCVPNVASRAGVAAGTIYRHFASKEALVNAVYRSCKVSLHGFMSAALGSAEDPRDGIHKMWAALVDFYRKHPSQIRFLEQHRHEDYLDEASREVSVEITRGAEAFLAAAQRAGVVRPGPPRLLLSLAFGAFVGLIKEVETGRVVLDEAALAASEAAVSGLLLKERSLSAIPTTIPTTTHEETPK